MPEDTDDSPQTIYHVVVNHEEQYSIWPAERDLPPGWRADGTTGTKEECLAHIDEVWTDMRPLSLRQYMDQMPEVLPAEDADDLDDPAESLVARLSREQHPVEISLRPERTGAALREAVERGYVFVRFTGTQGGTELGVRLDLDASELSTADYDAPAGSIHLVGDLTLDFEPVRCVADIDLTTMTGTGRLSVREPST
jgi:uncharacterized protein YbdZ (MbtH family)